MLSSFCLVNICVYNIGYFFNSGIELCYAPLGEFQIMESEDLLETLLKQQRLSSTHTIWTIKFEICGSKHHALSEFLPGEGPQQLCIIHCRAFLPEEDLPPSLSFPRTTKMFVFSEQQACKEYEWKRLRQHSSQSLQLSLMEIKAGTLNRFFIYFILFCT